MPAVADALAFEHNYTSGVIAWAPDDTPTDAQIGAVIDAFEQTAWAGLESAPRDLIRDYLLQRVEHGTLAPPISLDSRLAKTAGPERKGRDGPEAEGEQGDRRS